MCSTFMISSQAQQQQGGEEERREAVTEAEKPRQKLEDNTIFIGTRKPVMTYVVAVLSRFSSMGNITLKARGKAISTAVDVAQVTVKRFSTGIDVGKVTIGTETISSPDEQGRQRNVSTIEIELVPKGQ
jgi:DNA-binding protein